MEKYNNVVALIQSSDHPEMVKTLLKSGDVISSELTGLSADLWHMATGISGEAGELLESAFKYVAYSEAFDRVNFVEELGDLEFYAEGLRQKLNTERVEPEGDIECDDLLLAIVMLTITGSKILDQAKKVAIYNKDPLSMDFGNLLDQFEREMRLIRDLSGITRDETLIANIAKLGVRYKGFKYTDDAARRRDDKSDG